MPDSEQPTTEQPATEQPTTEQPTTVMPWRRWALVALAVALGLSWFALVAIARWLSPLHTFEADDWWPQASIWRLIVGIVLYLVLVPLLWRLLTREPRHTWGAITGLRPPQTRTQWLWTAAILLAVLIPGLTLLDGTARLAAHLATPVLILAALQPPVVEEVLMRGLFVHICEHARVGPVATTLLGTVVFTIWHIAAFDVVNGLITGLFSIPFFYVTRYLTGTVWVPIVVHLLGNAAVLNGAAMLALFLVELAALALWLRSRRADRRHLRRRSAAAALP